jgi:hypothetical protein
MGDMRPSGDTLNTASDMFLPTQMSRGGAVACAVAAAALREKAPMLPDHSRHATPASRGGRGEEGGGEGVGVGVGGVHSNEVHLLKTPRFFSRSRPAATRCVHGGHAAAGGGSARHVCGGGSPAVVAADCESVLECGALADVTRV